MSRDIFTFLVGGKAGEGVKKAGSVAAHIFSHMGRHVFQMDDYQSLIKGGHNFSVVSSAIDQLSSHYMHANMIISLDDRSYNLHENNITPDGISVYNSDTTENGSGIGIPLSSEAKDYPKRDLMLGVGAVAVLACAIGFDKSGLEKIIKNEYPKGIENNIAYSNTIYDLVTEKLLDKFSLTTGTTSRKILSGNEAISLGAAAGGLDIYIAYPMTPSSSILHYLAAHANDLGIAVMHPENEIAVANIAIGAAYAGARAMVGSSGGGFALMEEALSLAGMTETPLLCILSSRPGPSTGVPTYTEQADLRFALNQGHGDFPRIVCSPSSIEEAFYLTAEMLNLVWRFQTPGILLTEKHLSESSMTVELNPEKTLWPEPYLHEQSKGDFLRYRDTENGISPLLFPPSKELNKWSSYEHDELGISTEDPEIITRMHDKRQRKSETIIEHLKTVNTVNIFGTGEPIIFTYGSTTMSVLEALKSGNLNATVVQPKFLEPLPTWELEKFVGNKSMVVEQSVSGQFATLLYDKLRIKPLTKITRYDGRPFEPTELAAKISEVS
jgi:2-oxoglutarate ferredoxin oxidoreductase subunit alpha